MTPPPELLKKWEDDWFDEEEHADVLLVNAYAAGAQAGADQELEACCVEVSFWGSKGMAEKLRSARRPEPPSLKDQGLGALKLLKQRTTDPNIIEPLTRALEALPE
jgi:hypothetical protein